MANEDAPIREPFWADENAADRPAAPSGTWAHQVPAVEADDEADDDGDGDAEEDGSALPDTSGAAVPAPAPVTAPAVAPDAGAGAS